MGEIVLMDDRGRILIPREIRVKCSSRAFKISLQEDGSIVLRPLDLRRLGGKYRGLLKVNLDELEVIEEEYLKHENRI